MISAATRHTYWKTRSSTRLPFFALAGIAANDQIRRQQLLKNHSSNHDARYNDFAR